MFSNLIDRAVAIALALLVLILAPTATWNWWRKNVYYDALHVVAAQRVQDVRDAEAAGVARAHAVANDYLERSKNREKDFQKQLADLTATPPDERIVYRLRDRFLPMSCPAPAGPGAGHETTGGLQVADEQFLVRESARADDVADQANALIDTYNGWRDQVIKWNKEHAR